MTNDERNPNAETRTADSLFGFGILSDFDN